MDCGGSLCFLTSVESSRIASHLDTVAVAYVKTHLLVSKTKDVKEILSLIYLRNLKLCKREGAIDLKLLRPCCHEWARGQWNARRGLWLCCVWLMRLRAARRPLDHPRLHLTPHIKALCAIWCKCAVHSEPLLWVQSLVIELMKS